MKSGGASGNAGSLLDVVTFRLRSRSYAILLEQISGMSPVGRCRNVLGSPPGVLGLAEWKGRVLTVLDLPVLVADEPTAEPASLVRLARPYLHTALYVPATVRIDTMEAGARKELPPGGDAPSVTPVPGNGSVDVLLEPRVLVERLEVEIIGTSRRPFPGDGSLAAGGT